MTYEDLLLQETRRQFLGKAARGIGTLALAGLLGRTAAASVAAPADDPRFGLVNPRHRIPKAKRVIYLYMAGRTPRIWRPSTTSRSSPSSTASRCPNP